MQDCTGTQAHRCTHKNSQTPSEHTFRHPPTETLDVPPETNQRSSTWTFTASDHGHSVQGPSTLRCLGTYSHTTFKQMNGAQRKIHTLKNKRRTCRNILYTLNSDTGAEATKGCLGRKQHANCEAWWLTVDSRG